MVRSIFNKPNTMLITITTGKSVCKSGDNSGGDNGGGNDGGGGGGGGGGDRRAA